LKDDLALLEKSAHLVSIPECADWLLVTKSTFEFAEEFTGEDHLDEYTFEDPRRRKQLKDYIRKCLLPLREILIERLLFTAELMEKGKRSRKYMRMALCAALNLRDDSNVNFKYHPFVQALAKESIKEAVDYLREGGDYRGFFDDYGYED